MRRREFIAWMGGAAASTAIGPHIARADDYPTRPVTIIVPYTPGGSTEILARITAQHLERRLGQSVVVENKPGAGTVIGASLVAKATPDGYTLLMATPTPLAINVRVHKELPYDPATDFVPLVMIAHAPFMLIVNPALPVNRSRSSSITPGSAPGSCPTAPAASARRTISMPSCSRA